jgi:pimeloyl-ACP methyl ester carboxylesterase
MIFLPSWKRLALIAAMSTSGTASVQAVDSPTSSNDLETPPSTTPALAGEHVILLHGLCRTTRCMNRLERQLIADGYTVHNVGYPSRKHDAKTLISGHIAPAIERSREAGAKKIHVVAHSLGAILIRLYARDHDTSDLGRVVMLGPPNQGSEVVDKLGHLSLFQWLNGPAGSQLGTKEESLPKMLGAVTFETGVIAGNRSINLILSRFLNGKDDGKVSVENTKVDGASDHLVIRCPHPYLMSSRQSIQHIRHFLAHGEFIREDD